MNDQADRITDVEVLPDIARDTRVGTSITGSWVTEEAWNENESDWRPGSTWDLWFNDSRRSPTSSRNAEDIQFWIDLARRARNRWMRENPY